MADDSTAPADLDTDDPDADTVDEEGDTGSEHQQAQQPTEDWEARYKQVQSWATRESQLRRKAEDQLLASRSQQAPVDPTDPLASERARLEGERRQLQQEREWAAIQAEKPPEILDAYTEFQRGFALDPTPRGAVNAFEQGIGTFAARLAAQGVDAPPDRGLPSRSEATRPRVDASRSDAPDPDATQERIARAKAEHNVKDHVAALLFGAPRK